MLKDKMATKAKLKSARAELTPAQLRLANYKINSSGPVKILDNKAVEVPDHRNIWARPNYVPSNTDSMNKVTRI